MQSRHSRAVLISFLLAFCAMALSSLWIGCQVLVTGERELRKGWPLLVSSEFELARHTVAPINIQVVVLERQ